VTSARGRFLANRGAVVGAVLVALLLALVVFAPLLERRDPIALDIDHGLTSLGAPLAPSADAPLGTDHLGRDVWSRVVAGAGTSLEIATAATAIALVLGLLVGLVAGYAGGRTDDFLMRLVDLGLSFPFLLLAILLAALLHESQLGSSIAPVYITLGVVGWTTIARVVRGKTLTLARSEMVTAARALGASPARIITHYLLPNLASLVVAITALGFAQNLLAESVLSYLGLGPQPPTPSWGRMLYEGRVYYRSAPWLVLAPGVAIMLAVVGFNLVGDGLRDALDPRERR